MAIATRPKPKKHAKKRQAKHHRQGKFYMKSYLPYLPMLAIAGVGFIANSLWSQVAMAAPVSAVYDRPVTRVEALAGSQAAWVLLAVIAITTAAFVLFMIRHGLLLRRTITRSEYFIVHHPWLDISAVLIITLGVLLTRAAVISA